MVELEAVTVRFPRRSDAVLREVTLRLAPGEQVVVLGVSGSGKSTLLQTITGVVPHTVHAELTGHVRVAGTPTTVTSVVELSRHVGVLAQDPSSSVCLPDVEQELALPLENRAVDPAAISGRVDDALEAVGAATLRHRDTAGLSGGEGQRVALATALVAEPAVLLLDEPTSMLDPAGVSAVRHAVGQAVKRYAPAVVLVEHRLDDLAGPAGLSALPGRAVVLSEAGGLLADGPTGQVLRERAADLHAAGCWLPLDAELYALTGADGGLDSPVNQGLLKELATRPRSDRPSPIQRTPAGAAPPPNHDAPVLRARGLAVHRRGTAGTSLLTDVNLAVHEGEIVAVLGANGVGKSSLLLTLAGLLRPADGEVLGPRPGLVFQNPEHQFVAHTVQAEIAHGLPPDAAAAVVSRHLRAHRLEHLAAANPFRLSGGEKRRLSLAAMLAHPRPCLLVDEPTLGLDRRDTRATTATLRRAADEGRAVVLVSHDLRTVLTLADRAVVLAGEGVIADGPCADVLRDGDVVARAGLVLPPLAAWLLDTIDDPAQVRRVLRELDAAAAPAVISGATPPAAPPGLASPTSPSTSTAAELPA